MIRRALSLLCLCLAVHPSRSEEMTDMRAVDGRCEASSHIAEGPIGADLTKRQSRFFCNTTAVMNRYIPKVDKHIGEAHISDTKAYSLKDQIL
jgi:hypothetical protein